MKIRSFQQRFGDAGLTTLLPLKAVLVMTLFGSLASANGFGQTDLGTVTGRVTDASSAIIPNTQITLTSSATHTVRSTASNGQDLFISIRRS